MADAGIDYADPKTDPTALPPDPSQPLSYGKGDDLSKYSKGSPSLDDLSAPPGLTAIVGEKYRAQSAIGADILRQSDVDRQRRDKAFAATEVGPDSILFKGWNAEQESRKFSTNPLDAFGSLGSVFGIIGAAFTHAPMQAGMEASAAAINAINAGDEKAYERAHQAFKDNVELALKRHNIMEERYKDASSILSDNLNLGLSKMKIAAEISGDKQSAFLAEHGMVKEWYDLQEKRADAALKVKETADKLTLYGMRDEVWKRSEAAKSRDPMERMLGLQRIYGVGDEKSTPVREAMWALELKAVKENWPTEKLIEEEGKAVQKLTPQHIYGSGGANAVSKPAEIARRATQYEEDPESPTYKDHAASYDRAAQEVQKAYAPAITGNERDKIQSSIDRVDQVEGVMDKIEALLKKHNAITGFAGHVSRAGETVGEILGSNSSDFKEFHRLVSTLQTIGPRVLMDTQGRPIGIEGGRVSEIFAGNDLGDLNTNTLRAYKELRDIYNSQKQRYQKRLGAAGSEEKKPTGGEKWWESPVAGNVKDE